MQWIDLDKEIIPYGKDEVVIQQRLNHIREVCHNYKNNNKTVNRRISGLVWVYPKLNIHYCYTPKVGCTYWKRIMRFISGVYPNDSNIERPEDIDRRLAHNVPIPEVHTQRISNISAMSSISKGFSFLFARNPYSRLWSAYIDKFLLPDFWKIYGTKVIRNVRESASPKDRRCGSNVSFKELIKYIIKQYPNGLNEHFEPINVLCAPCLASYDVVGKLESFRTDSEYILNLLNMRVLSSNYSANDTMSLIQDEIVMLTNFNFQLESKIHADCFDREDVAIRLWKAFQLNGYIYRYIPIPMEDMKRDNFSNNPSKTFIDQSFRTLLYQKKMSMNLASQRKEMMIEAYRLIPDYLKVELLKIYELDFELFGYEKSLN